MARILVGTFPAVGHVNPFFPLVRALVARGHEVVWNTSAVYAERIAATGARFAPLEHAHDFNDLPPDERDAHRQNLKGVAALKADIKQIFIANAPRQIEDLRAITRRFTPDLILVDPGFIGGAWFHELSGIPLAIMNVLPMGISSRDTAPGGIGLPPDSSPLGILRNRALNWAVEHVLFRDVQQHWNEARAGLGLPKTGWFQDTVTNAELYMQLSVPGFEYPRSDLAPMVHFIGTMPVPAPSGWAAPAWWEELNGPRPVVHVTQGTVANMTPELIAPAIAGLADEDVLVVVSTGGRPVEELKLGTLPTNVRVGTFLSYPELLPRAAAMVTNGGYGGTQVALAHGLPLVVAGTTEDKLEVSARVAWSGAGINLKTDTPSPEQVRVAVRKILCDGRYRERAQALKHEYARYNAIELGAGLIERLAATARPVLRNTVPEAPVMELSSALS